MDLRRPLDKASGIPVYIQLEERIRLLVHEGVLAVGDALPTVRALAVDLGINANTVARVYRDLRGAGVLELKRGVGAFVAAGAGTALSPKDWQGLQDSADALVRMAKAGGMAAEELAQLIRARWKEVNDA